MSKFPDKAEKLAKAKELRLQGRSYSQIAEILGISWRTVMGWFNRHQGVRDARRAKKERAEKDIYYRVRLRLQVSKSSAKAKGYLPCTTAISTIVAAYIGTCKICDSADGATKKPLVIDHCHATGAFRGWICHKCNVLLGNADDNPDTLKKAAQYLATSAAEYRPEPPYDLPIGLIT